MSLAVVRCPGCRGSSRVSADALGQMVGCPRCQMPFVAEEDIPVVPVARAPRKPAAAVAPPRPRRVDEEPPDAPEAAADAVPDPEHDPHARPVAGLPVSVLVGLALVPFGIPLLWRVAPFVTGHDATLSMAVPVALAVAASALCLGVVYTIDWSAATRIKGVLMLVGLAYLSAAGLFFLKKDLLDRVRAWSDDSDRWVAVPLGNGGSGGQVRMPNQIGPEMSWPLVGLVELDDARRARLSPNPPDGPQFVYRFAVSKSGAAPKAADDAWFARVGAKLQQEANGRPVGDATEVLHPNGTGRQWAFDTDDANTVRIVRVYVIADRVYYLCAEGPRLTAEDEEHARPFFGNFSVN